MFVLDDALHCHFDCRNMSQVVIFQLHTCNSYSDPAVARVQGLQECKIVDKDGKPHFHPKVKEEYCGVFFRSTVCVAVLLDKIGFDQP